MWIQSEKMYKCKTCTSKTKEIEYQQRKECWYNGYFLKQGGVIWKSMGYCNTSWTTTETYGIWGGVALYGTCSVP